MSASITPPELEKILLALLKKMQKMGMLQAIPNEKQLVKTLAAEIFKARKNHLTNDDLKNTKFQKLLCVALISQHLSDKTNDKKFLFNFKKLFDDKFLLQLNPKQMKQLEKELKEALRLLLNKVNALQGNNVPQKKIDEMVNTLMDKFLDKLLKPAPAQENANALNDQLDAAMRELFGGVKPGVTGGIVMTVYKITGNLFGIADQQGGNEQSFAFIDEVSRYDGKADYTGIENENFQRDIAIEASGIDGLLTERSNAPSPNPLKTKPTPPGTPE